jgi:hypothetical protein
MAPVVESAQRKSRASWDSRPGRRRPKLALETQKKEVDVVRYYYVQDGEEIALHFVDGKLISSVPKLGSLPQTPVGSSKPAVTATPPPPGK